MDVLTTTSILSLFQTDKAQRFSFVRDVINRILVGDADPIKVHLQVKAMEEIIKEITSDPQYRDALLDESTKHGKTFERYNGKFSVKEVGVKYDYLMCGDPDMDELLLKKAELDSKIKARETFLKTVPQSGLDVVTEHGELVKIYPPVKTSTTTVTVSLS
jgi:hypothetical protein